MSRSKDSESTQGNNANFREIAGFQKSVEWKQVPFITIEVSLEKRVVLEIK